MKKILFFLLVIILQLASSALADSSLPRQEILITTSDYLLFLQQGVLPKESLYFYDSAMSQQIMATNEGDHLQYSILQGEEDKPLLGLTVGAATAYVNWLARDCPSPPGHGGDGAISYPLQEENVDKMNSSATVHLLNNDDGTFSIIMEPFDEEPSPIMMWEEDEGSFNSSKKGADDRSLNNRAERRSSNPSLQENDLPSEERIQADLRDHIQGIATLEVAGKVLQKRDQAYKDLKTARQKSPSRRRPPADTNGDESSTSDINSDWLDGTIYRASQMRVGVTALQKATQAEKEAEARIKAAEAHRDQAIAEAAAAKAALEARVEADRTEEIERAQQMAIWEDADQRIKGALEKIEKLDTITDLKQGWMESNLSFIYRRSKQREERKNNLIAAWKEVEEMTRYTENFLSRGDWEWKEYGHKYKKKDLIYWNGDLRIPASSKSWAEAVTATQAACVSWDETVFESYQRSAKDFWKLYFLARAVEKAALNNQKLALSSEK